MKQTMNNPGRNTLFVGGVCIPPGETREVEVHHRQTVQEPVVRKEDPVPETRGVVIEELSAETMDVIKKVFPTLEDADLVSLARLEEEKSSPRRTLLAMIAEEQLSRASKLEGEPE